MTRNIQYIQDYKLMKDNDIWPNFFIVGAAKAGTTTLYAYLDKTKGVYMSPIKEPRYFSRLKRDPRIRVSRIEKEGKYLQLFNNVKDEKAIGEASPSYLADPKAAELIHDKVPNAKIIILLRDPVERAFSGYLMRKNGGAETRPLHQIIEEHIKEDKQGESYSDSIIFAGLYTNDVKRYIDIFGSQNVKILIFEEFIKDTFNQVKEVLDFLGVDSEPPSNVGKVYNAYAEPREKISEAILSSQLIWKVGQKLVPQKLRRELRKKIFMKEAKKPKLSEKDGVLLQNVYQEDVNNLEKILGRKVPWKWFN